MATVDSTGLVTAVSAGSAAITVTTADGSFTASCAVTVAAAEAVLPAVSAPETDMSKIPVEDQDSAEEVASSVAAHTALSAAAQDEAGKLDEEAKTDLLAKAEEENLEVDAGETVSLYTQAYLEITAEALDKDKNGVITSITLDITPKVRVVASTAENSKDIKLNANGETNAVVVKQAEDLIITAPTTITVQLPAFAGREVFVKHEAESGVYFYKATSEDGSNYTFTSTHGFSPFTFSLDNEAVARVGDVGYDSLQAAVNAADGENTVEILKDQDLTASVSGSSRTFTLKNSTGSGITVILNGREIVLADGESETYAYTRPSAAAVWPPTP